MPIAKVGGSDFYYDVTGSGPPVILVSGLAGLASYWSPNIAELSEHYTVISYDHRGTGQSIRSEHPYSVKLLADDLVGMMDVIGIEKASLVGHSTGGAIGQIIGAEHPERIEKLVLYASWATLCPQMRLCMQIRQALLRAGGPVAFHRASPIFLYPPRYVCDAWDAIEKGLEISIANSTTPSILDARIDAVVEFDGRPYLNGIAAPTMVLVSEDDILTPMPVSEELFEAIPNAELKVLDYGAHAVSYCEPERFNAAIIAFLNN
jgi:aminoacrylate hydrolase